MIESHFRKKKVLSKGRKFVNLIDTSDIEDEEDYDDFDVTVEEPFPIPTVVDDLSALIVKKEKRKRAVKKVC